MKKPAKFFVGAVVVAVVGYGAFVYKDRFWEGERSGGDYRSKFNFQKKSKDEEAKDSNKTAEEAKRDEARKDEIEAKKEEYLKDCANKCSSWKDNEHNECLEACGLPEELENQGNLPCDQRTGDNKDNCFKDEAIKEKNDSVCDKIANPAIKEACVNAVAEEVLEGL